MNDTHSHDGFELIRVNNFPWKVLVAAVPHYNIDEL